MPDKWVFLLLWGTLTFFIWTRPLANVDRNSFLCGS